MIDANDASTVVVSFPLLCFQYGCSHVYTEVPHFVKRLDSRYIDDSGVQVCFYLVTTKQHCLLFKQYVQYMYMYMIDLFLPFFDVPQFSASTVHNSQFHIH